ncbi:dipeptide epimerase [Haloquadratum walsbyi]|uniref:Homolog to dipeptide epimerase n=1 Tax=Haloquadratum walsbyi (strain DSM 16854 / JCM 12705 / C23) TaxID=768065 RepID=G0LH55_HALWC|nr:dipeptide epimerase [Haloquadratum walsbyi]CCC40089.1 homolog to dipeptide epimerase [Haloquadratum walsbyi C23]
MKTSFNQISLNITGSFNIARGTTERVEITLIRIQDENGHIGIGGATPTAYYGETAATMRAILPEFLEIIESHGMEPRHAIEQRLYNHVRGNPAARAAVSTALADIAGKRADMPLYELWGLDPTDIPKTSYTISLDTPRAMQAKAETAVNNGFDILKLKLGHDNERNHKRIAAVRQATPDAQIRADANAALTSQQAVEISDILANYDIEFLEQPVPADDIDGLQFVQAYGSVPVAADESVITAADVSRVSDAVDIIVAKLMKCGTLREVRRIAAVADAVNCESMLGCMVESNVSIAAAWNLAPLFDYVDLDGSLLLSEDPIGGIPMDGNAANLSALDRSGTCAVDTVE